MCSFSRSSRPAERATRGTTAASSRNLIERPRPWKSSNGKHSTRPRSTKNNRRADPFRAGTLMASKTLLVAVDLGKASNAVASQAAALARSLSAKIVLLHVVEPKAAALPGGKAKHAPTAAAWPLRTPKSQAQVEQRLK